MTNNNYSDYQRYIPEFSPYQKMIDTDEIKENKTAKIGKSVIQRASSSKLLSHQRGRAQKLTVSKSNLKKFASKLTKTILKPFRAQKINKAFQDCKAHFALSAEHLAKGAFSKIAVQIVTEKIKTKAPKLSDTAPTNFFNGAYAEYSKREAKGRSTSIKQMKRQYQEELTKLKPGECMILGHGTKDKRDRHRTNGMIVKGANGKYSYYHNNTGLGLRYHQAMGEEKQKTLVLKEIDEKKMRSFLNFCAERTSPARGAFIWNKLASIDSLYDQIKKLSPLSAQEDGTLKSDAADKRYIGASQKGGSCPGQSELQLFRSVLTPEGFEEFEKELKQESAFKMFEHWKYLEKTDPSPVKAEAIKVAILHIIHELARGGLQSDKLIAIHRELT